MRTAVLGAGITGSVIARELARRGDEVVVYEASPVVGGLVASHEVAGTPIEVFYHHIFTHETHIRELIEDVGVGDKLEWLPSSVGILNDGGRLYPFTTPRDLLAYDPMPLKDRVRMGAVGMLAPHVSDWKRLDDVSAYDWVEKRMGKAALETIWDPMLRVKWGEVYKEVPAAWLWARLSQRARSRSKKGSGELLGYLRGGFRQLYDALARDLEARGVKVLLDTKVDRIETEGQKVRGVTAADATEDFDRVVSTLPVPVFAEITGGLPDAYLSRLDAVEYMWVFCTTVTMTRSLSPVYWLNVADRSIPFGAYIEHTRLLPTADYGDQHVAYLGRYFAPPSYSDEARRLAEADPDELSEEWLGHLAKIDPEYDRSMITSIQPARTAYAAPLIRVGHNKRRLPFSTPVDGLWLATMAQIYPDDRGQSEGVRLGLDCVDTVCAG